MHTRSHTYTSACTHTHTLLCIHTRWYIHIVTCIHAYTYTCMHTCIYECTHTYTLICTHTCRHSYIKPAQAHTHVRAHTYANTYTRTHTHTSTHTHKHIYAHTRILKGISWFCNGGMRSKMRMLPSKRVFFGCQSGLLTTGFLLLNCVSQIYNCDTTMNDMRIHELSCVCSSSWAVRTRTLSLMMSSKLLIWMTRSRQSRTLLCMQQ